jgi:ABC-2 type transport system ATP-binding protein
MAVLEINNLSKYYREIKAVDELDLKVGKGSIFGFLGRNGAGKTTTLRMITGTAKPTGGEIFVCGDRVRFGSCAVNRHIGYLPDVPEFYGFMSPREYLTLCGRLYGFDKAKIDQRCGELLPLVGLDGIKRHIGSFSRGMKQRLGIAQALIHEPELLILDEPTSALDPMGRRELLKIMASLRGSLTVIFSTHILSDVERICDTIGMLEGGRLALSGNLEGIRQKYAGHKAIIEINGETQKADEFKKLLSEKPYVNKIESETPQRLVVTCKDLKALGADICPCLAGLSLALARFEQAEPQLEDVFMEVIKDE